MGICKLTSDSTLRNEASAHVTTSQTQDPTNLSEAPRPLRVPATYHQESGSIIRTKKLTPWGTRHARRVPTSGYEDAISVLSDPVAPTIAMPNSRHLPSRTLNDGDGILEGDESSREESMESMESSDENVGPQECAEQPALELPIRPDAETSAGADRMLNNLLELGSNRKLLLSIFAKSLKDSPVGDYPRLA